MDAQEEIEEIKRRLSKLESGGNGPLLTALTKIVKQAKTIRDNLRSPDYDYRGGNSRREDGEASGLEQASRIILEALAD
jgi:hypothetical protein